METLIFLKRAFLIFGSMAIHDFRFGWGLLFYFELLLMGALNFYFIFALNPIFDGQFKNDLWMLEFVPAFSTRYLRAGLYGGFVAFPKFYSKSYPKLNYFDWRSRISPLLYWLCVIYMVNVILLYFVHPIACYFLLPSLKGDL